MPWAFSVVEGEDSAFHRHDGEDLVTGPSSLLCALQLVCEVALPRLRRAASAAGCAADTSEALAAAGVHCAHAATALVLRSLVELGDGGRGSKGGCRRGSRNGEDGCR